MANQPPTVKEFKASSLISKRKSQPCKMRPQRPRQPQAAPAAAATQVVFTDLPQTLGVNDLIDYLTKRGQSVDLRKRVQNTRQQGTYQQI